MAFEELSSCPILESTMQFIVSSSALLRQLQAISGVLNSSNTLPILDNFLFDLSPGKAAISASDIETTMTTVMDVTTEETGAVAIPAKMLLDILKTFEELPLTFKIDSKTCAVELTSEAGKYKLAGANADEFPRTPQIEDAASVSLDADVLADAVSRTLFAAGSSDLRPVMSGILFELRQDHLSFVATDAHRLVRYARTDASAAENAEMIVPRKPLNLLKNTLSTADKVVISFNESNAHFKYGDMDVICRLIEGNYPNYRAVIPKENPNCMTIDRKDFLRSIRRVSIFANRTTHQVRLALQGSELLISAEDADFANEANERLTCSYKGADMAIGFNSRFLMDMLNNLDSEQVTLELSAPSSAGIIRPAGAAEGEDILMLVMPVMLND
jgi:DNA polymerase-3 subunit beta